MIKVIRLSFLMILCFTFLADSTFAQSSVKLKQYNTEDGLAIKGYDPVTYFTKGKAVKGNKNISATADGIKYFFSSAENKELFTKDPAKYEPQYGGWCAYAIGAKGEKVDVDPKTFSIKEGKLFLFYNTYFTNTLPLWTKDEVNLKIKADQNWSLLLK